MPKTSIKVVELEKQPGVPELDSASAVAVASLQTHPGFQYLLAKLRFQRASLKEALVKNRHKDLKDVEFLQSGANWCGWLQEQVEHAIGVVNRPVQRPARDFELEAFERLRNQIDVIGADSPHTTAG